jgi:imidazolonepropionase-like amidohydrolase
MYAEPVLYFFDVGHRLGPTYPDPLRQSAQCEYQRNANPVMVVVEKNKYARLEKDYTKSGTGDKIVDLKKSYVLPGLIDMRVHLGSETCRSSAYDRYTQKPPGSRTPFHR